jgi:hypothetical protein
MCRNIDIVKIHQRFNWAVIRGDVRENRCWTFRPKERVYLMHWAWSVSKGAVNPAFVPSMPGVAIRWEHQTLAKAKAAARQMVTASGMVQIAALNSRHTDHRAIDMTLSWSGNLSIKRSDGSTKTIAGQPRNGGNRELSLLSELATGSSSSSRTRRIGRRMAAERRRRSGQGGLVSRGSSWQERRINKKKYMQAMPEIDTSIVGMFFQQGVASGFMAERISL